MHFLNFFYLCSKTLKESGWNFTWSFGKIMRSKSMKMVFVASIIRYKLCMMYAFLWFFCSKIIFDQKLFSYCCDKFDYPGSIVYLSCWILLNVSWRGRYCFWHKIRTICESTSSTSHFGKIRPARSGLCPNYQWKLPLSCF